MSQNAYKRSAAEAALAMIEPGAVIGIGTGSTVNFFIDALASSGNRVEGAVSSSEASSRRLEAAGIRVIDLNEVDQIPLYVDGADECNRALQLIKGGGGALTREKIVAAASDKFLCVADASKLVDQLGTFPLPVEVIPMACGLVARHLRELGGQPELRHGFTTDNGHQILDVHNLKIPDPPELESRLNDIPGVVTVGLFAIRPADLLLLGGPDGVREIHAKATFASVSD